jgi:hypothetical protein
MKRVRIFFYAALKTTRNPFSTFETKNKYEKLKIVAHEK